MTQFSLLQRNLLILLTGILIISITIFRSEWFWIMGWIGIWVYNLSIPFGVLLINYGLCRLIGLRWYIGVSILGVAESVLLSIFLGISIFQPSQFPKLHLIKNVYTDIHNTTQYDTSLSQFDSELGYLYRPNIKGVFKNWEFGPNTYTTNKLGLRDDSASANAPTIITLGDSFTTGWGVEQDETYADRLEKLLGVKVLNAGISSYGTIREGILLKKLPLDSCKLIILQYCYNDIAENKEWSDSLLQGNSYKPSFGREAFLNRQIQNQAGNMYVPFKYLFQISKKMGMFMFLKPEQHDPYAKHESNSTQEHMFYFFESLKLIRKSFKGNIIVISTSNSPRLDSEFIQKSNTYAHRHNLTHLFFIDFNDLFTSKDNYLIDGHTTASGHLIIAKQLYRVIKTKQLI